jgi:hypothetical protein
VVYYLASPLLHVSVPFHEEEAIEHKHLAINIIKASRAVYGEAHDNDVGVSIRQDSYQVKIFLSSSVPQRDLKIHSVYGGGGNVVFEDCGDVDLCFSA